MLDCRTLESPDEECTRRQKNLRQAQSAIAAFEVLIVPRQATKH